MVCHNDSWEVLVLDNLEEEFIQKTVGFLQSYLPKGADPNWSPEYFRWKLEKNPAGKGFLTCAVSEGQVVGVTSITLKNVWYRGSMRKAAEIGDTYTHPAFLRKDRIKREGNRKPENGRNAKGDYFEKSIFGRLVKETRERALKSGIQIIYGTPNENSRPGYEKRLNFKVHSFSKIQTFIRPTIKGISAKYGFPRLYNLILFAERIVEATCFLYWSMISKVYGYIFEKVDKPSDEFDTLWDQLKHQYQFSLVHNKEYFQYRFFDHPLGTYNVYKVTWKDRLCGVIVLRIYNDLKGRKCCLLADWIYDESAPKLFSVMLAHAIHVNWQEDVFYFSAWSGQEKGQVGALLRQGFFPKHKCPIIFFQNDEGIEIVKDGTQLNITVASTDNV